MGGGGQNNVRLRKRKVADRMSIRRSTPAGPERRSGVGVGRLAHVLAVGARGLEDQEAKPRWAEENRPAWRRLGVELKRLEQVQGLKSVTWLKSVVLDRIDVYDRLPTQIRIEFESKPSKIIIVKFPRDYPLLSPLFYVEDANGTLDLKDHLLNQKRKKSGPGTEEWEIFAYGVMEDFKEGVLSLMIADVIEKLMSTYWEVF